LNVLTLKKVLVDAGMSEVMAKPLLLLSCLKLLPILGGSGGYVNNYTIEAYA
jgi:hypothetical protein